MALRASLQDWAPRRVKLTMDEHLDKMASIGKRGSSYYCNPVVAGLAGILIWGFVIWGAIGKEAVAAETQAAQAWVTEIWNWLYMSSRNIWLLVLMYVLYKYYDIKLGSEEDKPEFSDLTYFAMLFSCGIATGLWYYSAEAMWHYEGYGTPRWTDHKIWNDNTRAEHAVMMTWFHWGLHGWIAYVLVGVLIGFMTYRRGFPMSMRFTMYPIIGELVYGPLGDMIEVLSILCTIFGICTSLGLGAMQINKGLVRLDLGTYQGQDYFGCDSSGTCSGRAGIEVNRDTQCIIIVVISGFAIASVILGLKAGIAMLSQAAFILSFFILVGVLFLDETWYILNALTSTLGYYIWYLPRISFHTDAWEELGKASDGLGGAPDGRGGLKGWMNAWTIFYWGWWISWGPFVGTFLARISRGRKLGNFIIASLILPSFWSFIFTGVFGAAQIRISRQAESAGLDMSDAAHTYGSLADKSVIGWNTVGEDGVARWNPVPDGVVRLYNLATEDVIFEHLCYYGTHEFATLMTVLTLICIVLYFVTSSDSASYVVDIFAANGVEEPPTIQKVFWGCTEGVAAIALLLSADEENPSVALNAVKAIPIVLGLPFTFLLFWMCQALMLVCSEESGKLPIERKNFKTFVFNLELSSAISIPAPFIYCGQVGTKVWGGNAIVYMAGFASMWVVTIVFFCLAAADDAFLSLAAAMYFVFAFAVGGMRTAVRAKLGITGDMVSDAMAGLFAYPWAIGQMAKEDFSAIESNLKSKELENPEATA
mmetsp:Transcript_76484/g.167057  ORF Transcript_76484/g.167057 Transcript_76484/m.167057 type:complete len:764 (-) Transcript_76484:203-2494(-)